MTRPRLQLEPPDDERDETPSASKLALGQTHAAIEDLERDPSDYLHMPWPTLDGIVGGISPGDVWFVGAFSGNGKTTFLLNLTLELLARQRTVYYLGLETQPKLLRTHLACLRLGYYYGDVATGEAKKWPRWDAMRSALREEFGAQRWLKDQNRLLISGATHVDAPAMSIAASDAALHGSDLLIIDHVDHLRHGAGRNPHEESVRVMHLLLDLAQRKQLRMLVATQLNNEAVRGDRLGLYAPPQPHHVYMGSHKRMIASGMLGLFRPMQPDLPKETLKAARAGTVDPSEVLVPNVMGVSIMKHRFYGNREGQQVQLGFQHGRVIESSERDKYTTDRMRGGPRP